MRHKDRLEITSNLRQQGVDPTQRLLSPLVSQVEAYATQRGLLPSEEVKQDAVNKFITTENKKFVAVLNNGRQVEVSPQTYQNEAVYNLLPVRYKTLTL
jgi:hypothetical protein